MAIASMTGFGRASGQMDGVSWVWEIRSVNARGLDIRLRLPAGFEAIEIQLRQMLTKRLARGSCSVSLAVKGALGENEVRLNEALLRRLDALAERAREVTGRAELVPLSGLLAMKGVIEAGEAAISTEQVPILEKALLGSFAAAVDELLAARRSEGERLSGILLGKIDEIEINTREAENSAERSPEAIARRLSQQIGRLLADNPALDEDRLYQEAVLIAVRADIEEELTRLHAHIAAVRDLLACNEPAGRRLEFLAQEFQREANTLCAKSNANEITRIGLRLKAGIDQFREQVQNVE